MTRPLGSLDGGLQSVRPSQSDVGDIVKVTPTSKAVGDMALFMVAGDLTPEDVLATDKDLAPPASVIDLIGGMMGQPPGGFPEQVQQAILRDRETVTGRLGASLPPADFESTREALTTQLGREALDRECVTHVLYPKVYDDFIEHRKTYGDVSVLPTPYFFYGPDPTEEIAVDIEEGKRLIVRFLAIGKPKPDGTRTVFFELNGQPQEVEVIDNCSTILLRKLSKPTQVTRPMSQPACQAW